MANLVLPARELVPSFDVAEDDDLVELIYNPISGLVYRQRFRMALRALEGTGPFRSVLEVGCGAGLLLPSLSRLGGTLHAVDVHDQLPAVQRMATELGLSNVQVRSGSVFELPYPTAHFDHVVCLSVLEQLRDLEAAAAELARVTAPSGWVVVGIPAKNAVTRLLFRAVGYDIDVIHPSSHRDILDALGTAMQVDRLWILPWKAPIDWSLYIVARLRVNRPAGSRP